MKRCHADRDELSTTDPGQIRAWMEQDPDGRLNLGMPTGSASGVIRLDIDGKRGKAQFRELQERWSERTGHGFPRTAWFRSGGRGLGLLFGIPDGISVPTIGRDPGHQGLRLLGEGSQTVLPPSGHPTGRRYEFLEGKALWDRGLVLLSRAGVDCLVELVREVTGAGWGAESHAPGASQPVELPDELPSVDVASLRVSERMKAIIVGGPEADPEERGLDRSEAVWAVIHAMLDAGYEPATIAAVLLDPENGISERHFRKSADPRRYVTQEIGRALQKRAPKSSGKVIPLRPDLARSGEPNRTPALPEPASPSAEQAKQLLEQALEAAARVDPRDRVDLLFSADVIEAAAHAFRSAPNLYHKVLQAVKEAGLPVRDWERRVRDRAALLVTSVKLLPTDLGALLENPPLEQARIPPGYFLTDHATYQETPEANGQIRRHLVAPAPVLITAILRDLEDGGVSLRLAWGRNGRWSTLDVDRAVALNARKIVDLAGQGFPVDSNLAGKLVQYLHYFESVNDAVLPVHFVTSHLGWQGEDGRLGFLWGTKLLTGEPDSAGDGLARPVPAVTFRPKASGDDQLAAGFHARGSLQGWLEAIAPLERYPRVKLALYEAFVPPLLRIVGAPNHTLDFAGMTSIGKTVAIRVAASVWGNPDEKSTHAALGTWDSTAVWIERSTHVLHDLPLMLDETKRVKRPELVAQMLYAVNSGRGRGRGNVRGLAAVGTWRTVLLSNGEQRATAFTRDGGTRARTLEITSLPFEKQDPETGRLVDRLNTALMHHYGHAGPLFVDWLICHRDEWEAFRHRYEELAERYAEHHSGAVRRIAQMVAAVYLAGELVHRAFEERGTPLPFPFADPVEPIWPELAAEAGEAPPEVRALRDIEGLARSRQERFIGRHQSFDGQPRAPADGWAGRWERGEQWESIAFYPAILRKWLSELGYEPDAVIHGWAQRGWLDVAKGRRYEKQVRVQGEPQWMIVIRREAFAEAARVEYAPGP